MCPGGFAVSQDSFERPVDPQLRLGEALATEASPAQGYSSLALQQLVEGPAQRRNQKETKPIQKVFGTDSASVESHSPTEPVHPTETCYTRKCAATWKPIKHRPDGGDQPRPLAEPS
jgi:hypothetical protein